MALLTIYQNGKPVSLPAFKGEKGDKGDKGDNGMTVIALSDVEYETIEPESEVLYIVYNSEK